MKMENNWYFDAMSPEEQSILKFLYMTNMSTIKKFSIITNTENAKRCVFEEHVMYFVTQNRPVPSSCKKISFAELVAIFSEELSLPIVYDVICDNKDYLKLLQEVTFRIPIFTHISKYPDDKFKYSICLSLDCVESRPIKTYAFSDWQVIYTLNDANPWLQRHNFKVGDKVKVNNGAADPKGYCYLNDNDNDNDNNYEKLNGWNLKCYEIDRLKNIDGRIYLHFTNTVIKSYVAASECTLVNETIDRGKVAPYDLWRGDVKKGMVYVQHEDGKNHFVEGKKDEEELYLPSELVTDWKTVQVVKKREVGEWVTFDPSSLSQQLTSNMWSKKMTLKIDEIINVDNETTYVFYEYQNEGHHTSCSMFSNVASSFRDALTAEIIALPNKGFEVGKSYMCLTDRIDCFKPFNVYDCTAQNTLLTIKNDGLIWNKFFVYEMRSKFRECTSDQEKTRYAAYIRFKFGSSLFLMPRKSDFVLTSSIKIKKEDLMNLMTYVRIVSDPPVICPDMDQSRISLSSHGSKETFNINSLKCDFDSEDFKNMTVRIGGHAGTVKELQEILKGFDK